MSRELFPVGTKVIMDTGYHQSSDWRNNLDKQYGVVRGMSSDGIYRVVETIGGNNAVMPFACLKEIDDEQWNQALDALSSRVEILRKEPRAEPSLQMKVSEVNINEEEIVSNMKVTLDDDQGDMVDLLTERIKMCGVLKDTIDRDGLEYGIVKTIAGEIEIPTIYLKEISEDCWRQYITGYANRVKNLENL